MTRLRLIVLATILAGVASGLSLGVAAVNVSAGRERERSAELDRRAAALDARDRLIEQLAQVVLAHRLAGVRVLLIALPGGQAQAAGVARMLALAGAGQVGQLEVTDKFADPQRADDLLDLAQAALPPSVTAGLPPRSGGVLAAATLLAAVLRARSERGTGGGGGAQVDDDRRSVLAAYTSQDYLVQRKEVVAAADVVIVLAPAEVGDPARAAAWLTLLGALSRTGPLVVAAPSGAGHGNLVAAVRANPQLRSAVSTVDNVGTPSGRLLAVWAASRAGHYGDGDGATSQPAP